MTPKPNHWLPRLLWLWALAALITFGALLTHRSDTPTILNRYSTSVAVMLAGLALAVIVGGVGGLLARRDPERMVRLLERWRANRWFTPIVLIIASIVLLAVWLFLLGDHLAVYALLRMFLVVTVILIALVLLFGGSDQTTNRLQITPLILIALAALIGVGLAALSYYPTLAKTDEAFVFSMGQNYLATGHTAPTIYRMVHPPNYLLGGLWTAIMGGWIRLAGFGLASGRLFFLLIGLATLPFIWWAARRLFDRATAWMAVLLGAFAVVSLNHVRADVVCAFYLAVGLFFYSIGQTKGYWWAHLLAGFFVGMCLDGTPIGFAFGVGLGLVYLRQYVIRIRRERQWFWSVFWLLALGGGIALGVYALTRSGPAFPGEGSTSSVVSNYLRNMIDGLRAGHFIELTGQYLTTWLTNQPILFGLLILGIITAAIERTEYDIALLILYAAWTGIIIFTYAYFPVFYIIHGLPITVLLGSRALTRGIPRLLGEASTEPVSLDRLRSVTAILLIVWLAAAIINGVWLTRDQSLEDLVETGKAMAQIVPPDAVIVAAEPYYFGMRNYPGFVGGAVEGQMINFRKFTAERAWETIAPDALVFSEKWPTEPERTPALQAYMQAHDFKLAQCYQTNSFGRVELWMSKLPPNITPSATCQQICVLRLGCK